MKAAILLVLLVGCGSARRGEPVAGPMTLTGDELRGERVFQRNCSQCHPGGEAGLGPALNDLPLPGVAIKTQVRIGAGAMPAFHRLELSHGDLQAVVDYLKALRHHRPTSTTDPRPPR